MTEEQKQAQEIANLKANSPFALPDDPSSSGWSTAQIKEKFYKAILILYEYLVVERGRITTLEEQGVDSLTSLVNDIIAGTTLVAKATADKDGNEFGLIYAKITDLQNGAVAVKKYLASDNSAKNISELETAINTLSGNLENLITALANGTNKVNASINADIAYKAKRDENGNVIHTTYATNVALEAIRALFMKLENGTSIARKAYGDQNGDVIDLTYLKIANIINDLTHTDTNKALSANMGKTLLARIVAIETLLASNDTDLDTLQEIVTYIKNNKTLIEGITSSKVSVSDIIDNYNSNVSTKPVSAAVAYALKGLIDNIVSGSTVVGKAADSNKLGGKTPDKFVQKINNILPDENGNITSITTLTGFEVVDEGDDKNLYLNFAGTFEDELEIADSGDDKNLYLVTD